MLPVYFATYMSELMEDVRLIHIEIENVLLYSKLKFDGPATSM
jgi:hypothetical protein